MAGPTGVRVEGVFNYTASDEFEVVQMWFGMRPAVLITPERDGTEMVLQLKVVDLEPAELVTVLQLAIDGIEKVRSEAAEEAEEPR